MSKHDKDYDTSMLRFVGNMIASQNWQDFDKVDAAAAVEKAIKIARHTRTRLREDAEIEGPRG